MPEESSDPEQNECSTKEVVLLELVSRLPNISEDQDVNIAHQDEMASDVGGTGGEILVCTIQISHIVCLQDQHNDPVDAHNDRIQAERRRVMVVLAPDSVVVVALVLVMRLVKSVVHTHNDKYQPREDGEDLVG